MDFTAATIEGFEFLKVANIKGKSSRDDTTKKVEWFKTREIVALEDANGYKVRYVFVDDEVITVLFGKCTSTRSNRIKHSRIAYSSHKISRGKYDHIQSLLKFVPNRIKHPRIAYSSHKISRVKYDHIQSLLKFVPNRIKHPRIAYSSHKISRVKYDHIQSLLKFVPNRIKHPRIAYSSHKISRVKYDHIQSLLKFVPPVYVVYDLYFRVLIQSHV